MSQEPQKSNTVLIVVAIIGIIGTIAAAAIGAIGDYNVEKLHQETELTRIALAPIVTQNVVVQVTNTPQVSSDFSDGLQLGSEWLWIDPLGDSKYSLLDSLGKIRLSTAGASHNFWGGNFNSPRLMQILTGDFVIETKVNANPITFYQGAGLLIHLDDTRWVKLQVGNLYGKSEVYLFENPEGLVGSIPLDTDTVSLRMERCGENVIGFVKTNNTVWQEISRVSFPASDSIRAGISIENEHQDGMFVADFDSFKIEKCP